MKNKRWSIGCDPGFGETGIVLVRHDGESRHVQAWATFSCHPNGSAYKRTEVLGVAVVTQIEQWCRRYRIEYLDFAIETPLWKKNARSFELQWRLVQELEGLVASQEIALQELWLTEVSPTRSKKMATGRGSAQKSAIVKASPFAHLGPHVGHIHLKCEGMLALDSLADPYKKDTVETLADAWAHSLATWGGCRDCTRVEINYKHKQPEVRHVCQGQKDS